MKQFQAYGNGSNQVRDTPRQAALAFFEHNPTRRKCDVTQGESSDGFFTVAYRLAASGERPKSWKGVTKKTAMELPDTPEGV